MVKEFNLKGHHYELIPIEGSSDYSIIKDGRQAKQISEEQAKKATVDAPNYFK